MTASTETLFALSLGLAGMLWAAEQARAEPLPCAPRGDVVARLADSFGETRRAIGLGAGGRVVELYASEASGSWTILVTLPTGLACLLAAGEAFEASPPAAASPGDPA
jgi:hypothetical protein